MAGRVPECSRKGGRLAEAVLQRNRFGTPALCNALVLMADDSATLPASAAPLRPWHAITTPLAAGIAALATLVGLLVLAWAILFITKGRFLRHTFETIVASQTHRQVKVAGDFQLYLNPFNIKLVAEGMTISNPEWAGGGNFFEASRIDTNIATFTLLFGQRRVNWLDLTGGKLDLHWDAARPWRAPRSIMPIRG
jgi:hypothetical protein